MELSSGFSNKCKLRAFRNWATACARQLRFPREGRGVHGHWAPGRKCKACTIRPSSQPIYVCGIPSLVGFGKGGRPKRTLKFRPVKSRMERAESSSEESTSVTSHPIDLERQEDEPPQLHGGIPPWWWWGYRLRITSNAPTLEFCPRPTLGI